LPRSQSTKRKSRRDSAGSSAARTPASKRGKRTGERAEGDAKAGRRPADGPFEVELVHARRSHLSWMLICLVLGALLLWKLAIIGKILGVVFLVVAVLAARRLLRTLLNEPGIICVDREQLILPLGLCRGSSREFSFADVRHAFFLRRAVPWTRAGPILIVEADDAIFSYPRDWFASEADQRSVLEAINERLGRM
jgi:hypothetical protein